MCWHTHTHARTRHANKHTINYALLEPKTVMEEIKVTAVAKYSLCSFYLVNLFSFFSFKFLFCFTKSEPLKPCESSDFFSLPFFLTYSRRGSQSCNILPKEQWKANVFLTAEGTFVRLSVKSAAERWLGCRCWWSKHKQTPIHTSVHLCTARAYKHRQKWWKKTAKLVTEHFR